MKIAKFSKKQKQVLNWFRSDKFKQFSGIIAEGAVRSGKTVSMVLGFLIWSMELEENETFAICAQSVGNVEKNIIDHSFGIMRFAEAIGFNVSYNRSRRILTISSSKCTNTYEIYGGDNERSQSTIQGRTFRGILFDEVAKLTESFVNMATSRINPAGTICWFNCNPDKPTHFFKQNWIDKAEEKKLCVFHFNIHDNLSLSDIAKDQLLSQYHGVFYKRFIEGLWTSGEGMIYDMFNDNCVIDDDEVPTFGEYYIACDIGHSNATAFLKIIQSNGISYVIDEYYHSGKISEKSGGIGSKTVKQYADDLLSFVGDDYMTRPKCTIIDPSALAFKTEVRNKLVMKNAKNAVEQGIQVTAAMIGSGRLKIHKRCVNTLREIQSYSWKKNTTGKDEPVKQDDHTCDALRYYCFTIVGR